MASERSGSGFREPLCILSHGVAEHGKVPAGSPVEFRSREEQTRITELRLVVWARACWRKPASGASGPYSFYQAFAQMHDLSSLGITTLRTISLSFC